MGLRALAARWRAFLIRRTSRDSFWRRSSCSQTRSITDEQIWEPAERGPYPLCQADACNVLAQLERSLGHRDSAIEAAMAAYRFAWCDGPPYAYHYGLINARRHLSELGVLEPQLAPFDESKFPPMPDVATILVGSGCLAPMIVANKKKAPILAVAILKMLQDTPLQPTQVAYGHSFQFVSRSPV